MILNAFLSSNYLKITSHETKRRNKITYNSLFSTVPIHLRCCFFDIATNSFTYTRPGLFFVLFNLLLSRLYFSQPCSILLALHHTHTYSLNNVYKMKENPKLNQIIQKTPT